MEECKLGATMISLSGRQFLRCRFGTWFAGLVGAWLACWFSGVGVPLWCLLSAFIPYPFFLVLAAFGLSHVIVIVIAVFLVGLCLHYVGSYIQLTRGFRCSTSLWLSTNMAGARGFCLFLFGTGVLGSKRVSPSSHSKFYVWNWVMSWAKGMGSRQTSKEFLEFDLNRISLVLVFGLVTCHDGFFLYLLLVSP